MAVIHATSGPIQHEAEHGIRPFDIGRDLRPVAELIADAFTNELDPTGKAALREMRIMSHLSGLLKVLSRSSSELEDVFGGFVWVEDGRIAGNVTVQRADKMGNRWQIANVAVAPAWRGRGIARKLMERALLHIDESGGNWAVLQVYAHNAVARALYNHLGFVEVGGTVDLRLQRLPKVELGAPIEGFRAFGASQWQPLYELASAQLHSQAQWWRPLRRSDFQTSFEQQIGESIWSTMGRRHIFRRCIQSQRRFEAALILTAERWRGRHKIEMWARPEQYGNYEAPLLEWMLATLQEYPRAPILATANREHSAALAAFERYGFQRLQTLITMRRGMAEMHAN